MILNSLSSFFFFFNDTATTEIYTLSLHDALPISLTEVAVFGMSEADVALALEQPWVSVDNDSPGTDRKSTRLNSSHSQISYAVFCLKKKKKQPNYHNYWRLYATYIVLHVNNHQLP